jgi:molecular chaperone DnaK
MPPIIGIDLGTTNTAVAVLEDGRPRVIEDDRGYRVLPSVISAKGEGRFVVGQAAHNLILTRPENTVYATKRLMGRRFDSPEVQRLQGRVGYAMREAPDGSIQVQVGDAWMTPAEVAAVVLQVARGIAEKAVGQPIEEAVITVPAHFNHAQRRETMEAARIAGLRCDRILNEPTAAALAYGHRRNVERTLVIFDLGGGTFDVSVLRLSDGIYEILATNGDTFLGGEDFDYRVVDHLADQLKSRTGVDLRQDRAALQRVKDAAERAKCELSFSDTASIVVPHIAGGQNLETTLGRTQLEALTRDLVERCITIARQAVAEAGLGIVEVDEVVLVGGQTRMPLVREAVAGLFGREPSRSVHPEEAVAIGAAVHAASLGDVEATPAVLLDVTPFDLGIDAAGGIFTRIVAKNARVPCSETRMFATVYDNQSTVKVTVRQGEGRLAEENELLGELLLDGLPPAPRMETKVAVTFRIDANGMLHVSAAEPKTGEKRNISIRNYSRTDRSTIAVPAAGTSAPKETTRSAPAAKPAAKAGVQKKKGFFDSLFGSKPVLTPKVTPATTPAAPAPAAAAADAPPVIAPLPTPTPAPVELTPVELAPVDVDAEEALEPVDADGAYEMGEEDLYGQAASPASFGLAGAHQAGSAAGAGDPFGDLGGGGSALDAGDLFGESMDEDGDDPPTDPGLARKSADAPFAAAARGPQPPPGLLDLFAAEAVPEDAPFELPEDAPFEVPQDAPFELPEDAPFELPEDASFELPVELRETAQASAGPALNEEDLFGFAFSDLAADEAADHEPATAADARTFPVPAPLARPPIARPVVPSGRRPAEARPEPDPFGFSLPSDDQTIPIARKPRKPARVRLQYRDRDLLLTEYRENLRRGGTLIKTDKPLALGRECVFEVSAPGLSLPILLPARVVRVLSDGMEVVYELDVEERRALEAVLRGP